MPGVATELLHGLASLGHRVDCFLPGSEHELPSRLAGHRNLSFVWGASGWRWNRWYSRTRIAAFASNLVARVLASYRLRSELRRRHRRQPYDVIYQLSNIESLSVPARLTRTVPLVIQPETHMAGELRCLIAERRLSLRCQRPDVLVIVAAIMLLRTVIQRVRIRRARLLVCISAVFREHLIRDYALPRQRTTVIPNPVRLERFAGLQNEPRDPPTILVLGRVSMRKGIEDIVAVAHELLGRGCAARVRVVGGPSLWSDYTPLLEDLPEQNSEYVGRIPPGEIPAELARSSVLLQASKYEPFGLTVAEALAAGVPVVGTSEVGALEGVDRSVASEVRPGDVAGMASALIRMLDRIATDPAEITRQAKAEAERLFAPDVVCRQLEVALAHVVEGP